MYTDAGSDCSVDLLEVVGSGVCGLVAVAVSEVLVELVCMAASIVVDSLTSAASGVLCTDLEGDADTRVVADVVNEFVSELDILRVIFTNVVSVFELVKTALSDVSLADSTAVVAKAVNDDFSFVVWPSVAIVSVVVSIFEINGFTVGSRVVANSFVV